MTNRTILNFSRINCAPINGAQYLARKGGGISPFPEGLIARYACYDKTNEDEDRDVLKDLSGNGHNIQLYNFAFAEGSGYGRYNISFISAGLNSSNYGTVIEKTYKKLKCNLNIDFTINQSPVYLRSESPVSWKLKADNHGAVIKVGGDVYADIEPNSVGEVRALTQEQIDAKTSMAYYPKIAINAGETITLEQIPEYKGALVSDGVDDYGLCDNFPILDRDRGYTVFMIRKEFKVGYMLSKAVSNTNAAFIFDGGNDSWSFNYYSITPPNRPELFSYQTSKSYNGKVTLKPKDVVDTDKLSLFKAYYNRLGGICSLAFYALEIYDRDLTDEEIAKVKARMIAEYEAKTGEKYTEETT